MQNLLMEKTEASLLGLSTFILMKVTGFYFIVTGGIARL